MKKGVTTRYDVAEHLPTPQDMAGYLEGCLEEADGNVAFIAKAPGDFARARDMAKVARGSGLSWDSLYKTFPASGAPVSTPFLSVGAPLGMKLYVEAAHG